MVFVRAKEVCFSGCMLSFEFCRRKETAVYYRMSIVLLRVVNLEAGCESFDGDTEIGGEPRAEEVEDSETCLLSKTGLLSFDR